MNKNDSVFTLIEGYTKKGAEAVAPLKKQCNWSKVLRFAPGMKIRPDELFQVNAFKCLNYYYLIQLRLNMRLNELIFKFL